MLRDDFMQEVINREKEPITPFLERARDLYEKAGVSTILVAGSSGAFFYIAEKVKTLCLKHKAPRTQAPGFQIPDFHRTLPPFRREASDMSRRGGRGNRSHNEHMKAKVFGKDSFSLDKETIDLRYVEQLADSEQTCALAYLLRYALEQSEANLTVQETVQHLTDLLTDKGWAPFCSSYVPCGLAKPRVQEIYACLNRFRG